MITVRIELKQTSQPIERRGVVNTYTKGDLYCVFDGVKVEKYPLANIWRITEE